MTSSDDVAAAAEGVVAFFAEHEVASMKLPSGWSGRPHDNWHQLTAAAVERDSLIVRLDELQVLTLDARGISSDARTLRVAIARGRWRWTDYGGEQEHDEVLGPGVVEFHAPSRE